MSGSIRWIGSILIVLVAQWNKSASLKEKVACSTHAQDSMVETPYIVFAVLFWLFGGVAVFLSKPKK